MCPTPGIVRIEACSPRAATLETSFMNERGLSQDCDQRRRREHAAHRTYTRFACSGWMRCTGIRWHSAWRYSKAPRVNKVSR